MNPNPVGWFEIYVQDIDRARIFYETVLEVTLEAMDFPGIEMFTFPMDHTAPGAGGAILKVPDVPSGGGGTMVYFSCEDCATEAARADASGGDIVQAKMQIGEHGFICVVKDPDGNVFGLHSMQ